MEVPVFGGPKHLDRFPDRGWLSGEVHSGHQQAPPVRPGLAEGCVELAGCMAEVGFGRLEGWVGRELESAEACVAFAVG